MFIGNSQKEARNLSSSVYRCGIDQIVNENLTRFQIAADISMTFAGESFTEELEDTESL